MPPIFEAIEAQALGLSATDKARLIERLISSLDVDPGIDDAWAAEVERRYAEFENGSVALVSGPEALAELKNEFR